MPTALPLAAIRLDDACQPRAVTDLNLAGEYAEAMLLGAAFPPVVVFGDGDGDAGYWLADGYHRWHAAEIAGLQTIACDVRAGGRREAILHSVGANAAHGWRRSREDKQRAVQTLLNDPEWCQWSDGEIGRRCGVDPKTVAVRRPPVTKETPELDQPAPTTRTYIDRHGNTSTMRTAGIGRRPEPDLPSEPPEGFPLREDPRQVDIEDMLRARGDLPAEPAFVYDAAAARFRGQLCELIETLTGPRWPSVGEAMDAWMKGRGYGPSVEEVRHAALWLTEFAEQYRTYEPQRLQAVDAMLQRAEEITNGAY
jgi:hypothetical protein